MNHEFMFDSFNDAVRYVEESLFNYVDKYDVEAIAHEVYTAESLIDDDCYWEIVERNAR